MTGAGLLAVDLGHHAFDFDALGDAMAVSAVVARNAIVVAQLHAHAGSRGFLAGIQMHETRDPALGEFDVNAIFEFANGLHCAIGVEQVLDRQCVRHANLPCAWMSILERVVACHGHRAGAGARRARYAGRVEGARL